MALLYKPIRLFWSNYKLFVLEISVEKRWSVAENLPKQNWNILLIRDFVNLIRQIINIRFRTQVKIWDFYCNHFKTRIAFNFILYMFSLVQFEYCAFCKILYMQKSIFPDILFVLKKISILYDRLCLMVGLRYYSEIYQNFRIFEKFLGHRVRHQK